MPTMAVSAVEHEPAQLVAQPLVVEDEIPDREGQLSPLPSALQAAGLLGLLLSRSSSRGFDRVGRGTELVGRHVAHRRCLTGGVRGMPGGATQVPGRGICMAGRRPRHAHPDLASRPGTSQVDRASRTVVLGPDLLEMVEHVLRAVGRPQREKVMIVVLEAAASTQGDEPRIARPGEDHSAGRVIASGLMSASNSAPVT